MPSQLLDPKLIKVGEIPRLMDCPFVYQLTSPSRIPDVPSVTISELTPIRAITLPLLSPMNAPNAIPIRIATARGAWNLDMAAAVATWETPAIGPTEKSNWPHTRGMMDASARMPR